jgi:RNA polymerase sigma-70 factor, ECF subfamily
MTSYKSRSNTIQEDYLPVVNTDKEIWLSELMDDYGDVITRLAYSYVRNMATAEDIAQTTFIKCYQHSSTFRGDSSIKTWLYKITINSCKDYLRSSYFKRILPSDLIQKLVRSPVVSTESVYLNNFESNFLVECIFALPYKYREVIVLYYYDDLKIKEMEEILKLNGNTIKTRLRKAKKMLKEQIESKKGAYTVE